MKAIILLHTGISGKGFNIRMFFGCRLEIKYPARTAGPRMKLVLQPNRVESAEGLKNRVIKTLSRCAHSHRFLSAFVRITVHLGQVHASNRLKNLFTSKHIGALAWVVAGKQT